MARASAGGMSAARTVKVNASAKPSEVRMVFVFIVVVFRDRAEALFTRFSYPAFYLPIGLKSYQKQPSSSALVKFARRLVRDGRAFSRAVMFSYCRQCRCRLACFLNRLS